MQLTLKEKAQKSQGFHCVFNYWEHKPSQYEAKLQEFKLAGFNSISVFVPWAHLEADIYHSLEKFLLTALQYKIKVLVIVTPTLGVHYPNSGIPKEVIASNANQAVDANGETILNLVAPNVFTMPSFSSPEVLKAYGNFLLKLSAILGEVERVSRDPHLFEVYIGNGLFPYYRVWGAPEDSHGDFSASNVIAFREFVQKSEEAFRIKAHEPFNRHQFHAHVENKLREKTNQMIAKKIPSAKINNFEVLNPEAAPEFAHHMLLSEAMEYKPSIEDYFDSILKASARKQSVLLSNTGTFRKFTDQQKYFIFMTAFLCGRSAWIQSEEYLKFSPKFIKKTKQSAELIETGEFVREYQVAYVSANKYSMELISYSIFRKLVQEGLSVCALGSQKFSESLIFLDPKSSIRTVELVQYLSLAQNGKTVAIPAPMKEIQNYTEGAQSQFDKLGLSKKIIHMNLGIPYQICEVGFGQVVFYDPLTFWKKEKPENLSTFFNSLLGLAEVKMHCSVSDARVKVVSMVSESDNHERIVTLMNPTDQPIEIKVYFADDKKVSTLGSADHLLVGKMFEMTVPALGILPMRVTDAATSEIHDQMTKEGGHHGIEA